MHLLIGCSIRQLEPNEAMQALRLCLPILLNTLAAFDTLPPRNLKAAQHEIASLEQYITSIALTLSAEMDYDQTGLYTEAGGFTEVGEVVSGILVDADAVRRSLEAKSSGPARELLAMKEMRA